MMKFVFALFVITLSVCNTAVTAEVVEVDYAAKTDSTESENVEHHNKK